MGTWSRASGVWTMSGSAVRTALLGPGTMPRTGAIRIQCARPADNVLAFLLGSRDGRAGWELGISGANAVIQDRTIAGVVTGHASAAHGLTAGVPFTMEARVINNVTLALHLNGASSPVVTFDIVGGLFASYRNYGFASAVVGASVLSAELCSLMANVSDRETALVVVAGGDAWVVSESGDARLVRAGAFGPTAQVSLADFDQKVYGVDGASAWIIDPKLFTATAWGAASGDGVLPGASETSPGSGVYVPGTTRMKGVRRFLTRLGLWGDPQDPQNLFLCRIGDGNNWNTAADTPGRAWALSTDLPGRIGDPIVAVEQVARGVLIVGCAWSMWEIRGDPALGIPQVENRAFTLGPSGPNAMFVGAEGRLVFHAPQGVYLLGGVGDPIPLSEYALRERITLDPDTVGDYLVQMVRDPRNLTTYAFLTPREATGNDIQFAYEEAVGGWDPREGGWQPDVYADRLGPTASEVWNNRLVAGTRDGFLITPGDAFDDDGEAYGSYFTCAIMDQGDELTETLLNGLLVTMTEDSEPVTYAVFQGLTAELAERIDTNVKVLEGVLTGPAQLVARPVRGTALVLRLSNGDSGQGFRVESVEIDDEPGASLRRRTRTTTIKTPCRSPDGDVGGAESETVPSGGTGPGLATPMFILMATAQNNSGGDLPRYAGLGMLRGDDRWGYEPGESVPARRTIGGGWGGGPGGVPGDPGGGGSSGGYKGGSGTGGGGGAVE